MRYKAIPNKDIIPEQLNHIFQKYTDVFDKAFGRNLKIERSGEIISEWYVTSQEDIYENYIFPEKFKTIIKLRSEQIKKGMQDLFRQESHYHGAEYKGDLYFLVGKIGTGKTTFLLNNCVYQKNNIACYIDLHALASEILPDRREIIDYINSKIDQFLKQKYRDYFSVLDLVRRVFGSNVLEGVSVDILSQRMNNDKEEYRRLLIDYLFTHENQEIMFILDNGDTCDIRVLDVILTMVLEMLPNYPSMFIMAIRDYIPTQEVFHNRTQYHFPLIQLPINDLSAIIKKRMQWAIKESDNPRNDNETLEIIQEVTKGDKIINTIRHIITPDAAKRMLERCTDHFERSTGEHSILYNLREITDKNIREALDMVYAFFHSSKLDYSPLFLNIYDSSEKIIGFRNKERNIDFKDFIDCSIAKHKLCFDNMSPVLNIFNFDNSVFDDDYINTLGIYLVLKIVGNGDIDKNQLMSYLNDLRMADNRRYKIINYMLGRNLITSTKHEGPYLKNVSEFTITSKGKMYLDYLPFRFSYLYFVSDDTPMDKKYCVSYEDRERSFEYRKKAVHNFIEFLKDEEKRLQRVLNEKTSLRERIYGNQESLFSDIENSVSSEMSKIEHSIKHEYTIRYKYLSPKNA